MAYLLTICNKLMGILVSNQELIAWTFLGTIFIICGIFTFFIVRAEK